MASMNQRPQLFVLFCIALLGFAGCANEPPADELFTDCRYAAPKPIFHEGLESVARHHFQLEQGKAVESLSFDDGLQLQILQTGCDHIHQEFRFELDGGDTAAPDNFWISEAAGQFYRLGQLGASYVVYLSLARALDERNGQFRLGESIELQAGFYAKVERQNSRGRQLLAVSLSEQPLNNGR